MRLSKTEAKRKHDEAIRKGYSAKLGADYLRINKKGKIEEFEVK